jgi:Domain of unknown function (DUF6532)
MVCACVSNHLPVQLLHLSLITISLLQIVNCLEEWQTGTHVKIPFSGDRYETVYKEMGSLIQTIEDNAYHGRKLRNQLSAIATDGQ